MEQNNCTTNDVALSKFINKVKKKLNGAEATTAPPKKTTPPADYTYTKSNKKAEFKKLEAKVLSLLKTQPNATDPLGQLIDYSVYNSLSEQGKSMYILNLSKAYNQILEELAPQM